MTFLEITAFLADLTQIALGVFTAYIAFTQKDKISAAFSALLNYSFQTSLSEFKYWLQQLSENIGDDAVSSEKTRVALAYLVGKIKGNKILYEYFGEKMLRRLNIMIDSLDAGTQVNQSNKVRLCSELRESLASLEVERYKTEYIDGT